MLRLCARASILRCLLAAPVVLVGCSSPPEAAASAQGADKTDSAAAAPADSAAAPAPANIHAAADPTAVAVLLQDAGQRLENSRALKPEAADYVVVFGPEYGPALEAKLARAWAADKVQPGPWAPDQSEIVIFTANTQDFKTTASPAKGFPRGYQRLHGYMQPNQTFHAFRYVRKGEAAGASYDALVRVGDKWRFFPKPWVAAEQGSKFFAPNPAEAVCLHIQRAKIPGAQPYANCVHAMSKRAEDYGDAGFAAYSACVLALDASGVLESCTPNERGAG